MRVLIAMDSFKGALGAPSACDAVAEGVRSAAPHATICTLPLSDGGEGMLDALSAAGALTLRRAPAADLFGTAGLFSYGVCEDGTAVVETAVTCGLPATQSARDPMTASSRGVGMQIAEALASGAREIVVALGGSGCVDGGMGALAALGARFYNGKGALLVPCGSAMAEVEEADLSGLLPALRDAHIRLAADVTNPYCGRQGAAVVYGPQKGATPEMVAALDVGLANLAVCLRDAGAKDPTAVAGAGAAGGLCGGLYAVANATMESGFTVLASLTDFDAQLAAADIVITGEGKTDAQTLYGKLPLQVARRAKAAGKPVFCLSGSVETGAESLYACGVTALLSIADSPMSLYTAMERTPILLTRTADAIMRTALALAPKKYTK